MRTLFLCLFLFSYLVANSVTAQDSSQFIGDDLIDQAVQLSEADKYHDALDAFNLLEEKSSVYGFTPIQLSRIQYRLGEAAYELSQYDLAEAAFERSNSNFLNSDSNSPIPNHAYLTLEYLAVLALDGQQKTTYYDQMIELVGKMKSPTPEALVAVDYILGVREKKAKNYGEAISYFKKAAQHLAHAHQHIDLYYVHNALADTYFEAGDYANALLEETDAYKFIPDDLVVTKLRTLTNLAGHHLDLRQMESTRNRLREFTELANTIDFTDNDRWNYYYALKTELHNTEVDLDSMEIVLDEQAAYFEKYPHYKEESSYRKYLNQRAGLYIRQEKYGAADTLLNPSPKLSYYNLDNWHARKFLLSKVQCHNQEFETAVTRLNELICTLVANEDAANCAKLSPHTVLTASSIEKIDFTLIEFIKDKASYYKYWYDIHQQDSLLTLSNRNINLADSLLARAKINGSYPGLARKVDELSLELRKIQMENIFISYQQNQEEAQITEAFNASERIKQLAISERLHQQLLTQNFGLPKDLIEKERTYAEEIERIVNELKTAIPAELQTLKDELGEFVTLQKRLRQDIQAAEPAFFDLLYTPPAVELDQIRRNVISENEVLLQYMIRERQIYVVAVSQQQAVFKKLPLSVRIDTWIPGFVDEMRKKSPAVFPKLRMLYKDLIAPLKDIIGEQDLVIIPDGHLWYVPFAALLTKDEDPMTLNEGRSYLVKEKNVRHLISGRLALFQEEVAQKGSTAVSGVLSMSPLATDSIGKFPSLPASQKTQQLLRSLSYTRHDHYFTDQQANPGNFNTHAPGAALLHIGTHTQIDDEDPAASFLVFSGDPATEHFQLKAAEIYNMELPAHLAVLLACSTAEGKIRRGQGVANLARAFAHAGCRNLVVNLWEIEDKAALQLMQSFYPSLIKDQLDISSAFNQAQRNYISSASKVHPGYWATSIYIGEDDPLELNNKTSPWLYPMLALGCLLACGTLLFFSISAIRKG